MGIGCSHANLVAFYIDMVALNDQLTSLSLTWIFTSFLINLIVLKREIK